MLDRIEVPFEIKATNNDDKDFFTFEGLASTFGNVDQGGDVVVSGAFNKSLVKRAPVILWQHNSSEPIGMPVEVKEVQEGLYLKARLPKDDTLVKGRVIPQMKVGSIRKMSIGFNTIESDRDRDGVRLLKELDLWEVSLVTFPMNEQAGVTGFKSKTGEKLFNLEDVAHIADIKSLREFLKNTDIFTKQAREHVLSKFSGLSDSNSDNSLSDSSKKAADELKAAFQTLNNNLKL